uniref:Electron transfer flavoprotein subunit beta n=1 Tax=Stygiella incarcerata TaxID=1712417 RepID=A0A192ZIK1_9EUKA|nr:ETF-beta [Stygiella incarcerata]
MSQPIPTPPKLAKGFRVLVGVKRVIDYAVKVRVAGDGSGVVKKNVKHSMNPFDEIALEEAVRMKESGVAGEVVAVSIGPKEASETLRTACAMGADRAIHIISDCDVEPLAIAKVLSKIVSVEQPNVVIVGKQSIDDDSNQTGQMLAGLLSWPQGTFASSVTFEKEEKDRALVSREVDEGEESLRLTIPCVITADLRLNEPRYATLPNIMKAKRKKITTVDIGKLGVDVKPRFEVLRVMEPPTRKAGSVVESVDELLKGMREAGTL